MGLRLSEPAAEPMKCVGIFFGADYCFNNCDKKKTENTTRCAIDEFAQKIFYEPVAKRKCD